MGLSAEPPKDPFRTGMAVLNLLGDAAERAPVVVVAEDAHWLDEATTEVLAFVARRIEADAITILVTSRETIPRALRGLPSRTLAPLTSDAAEALLHGLDGDLAPATRARILEQAQGNPLGLVELLASATRAEQEPDLPTWLPLSTRLERTFSARVADLPKTTRAALLVAALTDRADVTEVLAAASVLAQTPLTLDVLTPAVAGGADRGRRAADRVRAPAHALRDRAGRVREPPPSRARGARRDARSPRFRSAIASRPRPGRTTRSRTSSPASRTSPGGAGRWCGPRRSWDGRPR